MNANRPVRVLCVDDNRMVASALERRLEREPDLLWVGLVADGANAEARTRALRPDVILLDIDMPGVDTFALTRRFADAFADVRILMFSGHVNREFIERALDCGAWGFLSKNDDVAKIIEGIRAAARGEIALSEEAERIQRIRFTDAARPAPPLSPPP